ncbi:hypothetical protein OQJ46_01840 [Microbulbifer thermotolerans]|uniref:hypothetical protein n=1 Tax=Microbulbifer thermotolerans TaxID=252514 RepID=UPI00224A7CA1|nr:hypothetical protein [Microbulbifer thermotolerans]MCX2781729.1 hypothetical protein [Microbulbifer thermotolerans]
MTFLDWAESSSLGLWVSDSLWGYPIVLTLHTIGMSILVGIALMISFRLLGFCSRLPLRDMYNYWKVAIAGFCINLLSGTALFFGGATLLWENRPFLLKITLIATGLLLSHYLATRTISDKITSKHKFIAGASIFLWIAALVSGRLIAYID